MFFNKKQLFAYTKNTPRGSKGGLGPFFFSSFFKNLAPAFAPIIIKS